MGYDPNFIDDRIVPLPVAGPRVIATAFDNGSYIHHSRHSLIFNKERGFATCTAHNIDGVTISESQYSSRSFKFDPLIKPNALQVDRDRGYRNNPWDQGHLTRRKSLSWGDPQEAAIAERESDHWSNIAPQHENLHDDAWGLVEDWMLGRVQDGKHRACVFAGPVFTEDDPVHQNAAGELPIRIPAGFWKVVTVELGGAMRSAAFLLWQRDYDNSEPLPFAPILEQVRLTTIEVLTGLSFPELRRFDPLVYDRNQNPRINDAYSAQRRGQPVLLDEFQSSSGAGSVSRRSPGAVGTFQPVMAAITHGGDILL